MDAEVPLPEKESPNPRSQAALRAAALHLGRQHTPWEPLSEFPRSLSRLPRPAETAQRLDAKRLTLLHQLAPGEASLMLTDPAQRGLMISSCDRLTRLAEQP